MLIPFFPPFCIPTEVVSPVRCILFASFLFCWFLVRLASVHLSPLVFGWSCFSVHRRCVGVLFISSCTNRDNHTRPPGTEDGLESPLPLYDCSPVYRPGLFPLRPRMAAGPAVSHLCTRWFRCVGLRHECRQDAGSGTRENNPGLGMHSARRDVTPDAASPTRRMSHSHGARL